MGDVGGIGGMGGVYACMRLAPLVKPALKCSGTYRVGCAAELAPYRGALFWTHIHLLY